MPRICTVVDRVEGPAAEMNASRNVSFEWWKVGLAISVVVLWMPFPVVEPAS